MLDQNPGAARDRDTVNVIVGECFDGWLSDARALAVRPDHALEAIAGARPDETGEGAVGAGTGTTCFGFKAGRGQLVARGRRPHAGLPGVSNYGSRSDLHLLVGQDVEVDVPGPGPEAPAQGGSIMIVLGTDAPLSERQLRRLASRGTFGLGRAGSFGANASGEYVIAFSTAHRVAHRVERDTRRLHLPARRLGRRSRPVRGRRRGGAGVGPELAVRGRRDGGPRRQPRRGFSPRAPRRGAVPSAGLTKTRAASPSRPRRAAREPSARRTCRTRSSCSRSCRTSR